MTLPRRQDVLNGRAGKGEALPWRQAGDSSFVFPLESIVAIHGAPRRCSPSNTKISCEGRHRKCPDLVSCILLLGGRLARRKGRQCAPVSMANPTESNGYP